MFSSAVKLQKLQLLAHNPPLDLSVNAMTSAQGRSSICEVVESVSLMECPAVGKWSRGS